MSQTRKWQNGFGAILSRVEFQTGPYTNRGVYVCNAILVTKIFCYQYSTNNNSANK